MGTIPNRGTAGSAIDATTVGLVRVQGPAIWVQNPTAVTNTNFVGSPSIGKPTDSSWDYRMECTRPSYVTSSPRPAQFGIYPAFTTSGFACSFYASDASFPAITAVPSATLDTYAAVGELIQWRVTWDAATDTLKSFFRPAGTPIDAITGWSQTSSNVHAGKQAATNAVQALIAYGNSPSAGHGYSGAITQHYVAVNGVAILHIDETVIPADPTLTSFPDRLGKLWVITRAATGPVTTIVPAGAVTYANPDQTVATNRATIPDNAVFDVANTWGYFTYDGVGTNYLSTPDAAALDIVGDIELVVRARMTDWSPGVVHEILNKYNVTGNQRSYRVFLSGGGAPAFTWSVDGTAVISAISSAVAPFADAATGWIKVTFDVDNDAAGNDVKFWTAPDSESEPTVWTQLGTTITTAGVSSIFSGSSLLNIGSRFGVDAINGRVYRAIVRNGIGGTTVFDTGGPDIPANGAASYVCTTGQTVTVNGTLPVTARTGEDAVLVWVGQMGNQTGAFRVLFGPGAMPTMNIGAYDTVDRLYGSINTGSVNIGTFNSGVDSTTSTLVVVIRLDRAAGLLKYRLYDSTGLIKTQDVSAVTVGAILPSVAVELMKSVPGTVSAFAFSKGVGVAMTDAESAALARRLLVNANRPARSTTGALPPAGPHVYGDRWMANNGHIVLFNGAQWTAVTPPTGNTALLVANMQFLMGGD